MGNMKKVILSFDDGYEEDYKVVYPFLKRKGIKATSFLVTNDVGKNGYISWENVREMVKYGWEFGCHTDKHLPLDKVSKEEIEREIFISKNEFWRRSLPVPEYFAYPFCIRNNSIIDIVKKYFKGARGGSTSEGHNYDIVSYGLHGKHDIKKIVKENDVIFLHTHDVSDNHRGFGLEVEKFKEIINYLVEQNCQFITMSEYSKVKSEKRPEVVIMAAGPAHRWGNYLGVPKQLIEVEGEKLLHRTIRLLRENGVDKIFITVPKKGAFGKLNVDEEIVGNPKHEINKFLNAKEHAGAVFLWGDCYFSEKAIKTILKNEEPLMFFGNAGGNKYTGKKWGEIFAVKTNNEFFKKVVELEKHKEEMPRCASWELFGFISTGKMPDRNFAPHKIGETDNGLCIPDPEKIKRYFTQIHDFTDDFDYPADYDNWIKRYNKHFLKDAWEVKPRKKFTVSYNIMAHPSRKKLVSYLQGRLGDVKVIWDKTGNIWDTRKMCLEDHIKQGKDFGITIQDDTILCRNFKERAERFINQIKEKEAIYNFFYRMYLSPEEIEEAIKHNRNYIKNKLPGIVSEIVFAFPTHLMREMIDVCDSSDKMSAHAKGLDVADWVMDERYVKDKGLYSYFCIPSLADHRFELDSLYYPKDFINKLVYACRMAWWFCEDVWEGQEKKDNVLISIGEKPIKKLHETQKPQKGFAPITNKLGVMNAAYGTDLIFGPNETKFLPEETVKNILSKQDTFYGNSS
jgi:peptidoglycan/xylan/chitin deacetylase (PgdA/CDA1 family)